MVATDLDVFAENFKNFLVCLVEWVHWQAMYGGSPCEDDSRVQGVCIVKVSTSLNIDYLIEFKSNWVNLHAYLTFLGYPVRQRVSSSWQEAWSWWAHSRLESVLEASWQRGHVTIRQKSSVQATRLILKSEQNCLKTALWRWGIKSYILHVSGRETPESRNTYN